MVSKRLISRDGVQEGFYMVFTMFYYIFNKVSYGYNQVSQSVNKAPMQFRKSRRFERRFNKNVIRLQYGLNKV